jgi:serine/threonine protein kinase
MPAFPRSSGPVIEHGPLIQHGPQTDADDIPATVRGSTRPPGSFDNMKRPTAPSFPRVEAPRLPGSVPPPPLAFGQETPPLGVVSLPDAEVGLRRARTLSRLAEALPGRLVRERYRVGTVLGQGATSVVFSAIDTHADDDAETDEVALKVLDPSLAFNAAAMARFRLEAKAAMAIESSHVIRVFQADTCEATHALVSKGAERKGVPFISMELLEGTDLRSFVHDHGPLAARDVTSIFRGVATALDLAHGAGIIHRDLKPANLFLTSVRGGDVTVAGSTIKVLDFGLAELVDGSGERAAPRSASAEGFFGTPWFMAPEQISGERLGPATDRWALGLIAFRLLTAESYWAPRPIADLFAEIVAGPRIAPSEIVLARSLAPLARLGAHFDAWFMRACDVDPARRFGSAREQADALDRALERDATR